jgi:hypothetical protein
MQHLGSALAVTRGAGWEAGSYLKNTAQLSLTLPYSMMDIDVSFFKMPADLMSTVSSDRTSSLNIFTGNS